MTAQELELGPIRSNEVKVWFEAFETSYEIIRKAGSRITNPQTQPITSEAECHAFIRSPLPLDKRKNFVENRLRVICVYTGDKHQASQHKSLLKTAEESGCIHNGFPSLVEKGTTGSAVLSGAGKISLFLQTPRDSMPYLAVSMTEIPTTAPRLPSDWVCVVFTTPDTELQSLLREESFPTDYNLLFPDFMYIFVRILEDQVALVRDRLHEPTSALMQQAGTIIQMSTEDFGRARRALFDIEKQVRELRDRWRFAQELADNLMRCFAEIVRLRVGKTGHKAETYSQTLLHRVDTQIALAKTLQLEFDSLPSVIEEQHRKIEAEVNLMIAHNSFVSAEEARRDGASMKTIAAITLIFLPATTVASIFSMSMFNWSATDGQSVVSHRLWLYFVIAVGLTVLVLAFWVTWWFAWNRRENRPSALPWGQTNPTLSERREQA